MMRFLRLEKRNFNPTKILWVAPTGDDSCEVKLDDGYVFRVLESCADVTHAIEVALSAEPEPDKPAAKKAK